VTWYCPKCEDEHAEDEQFSMIEQTQFCEYHARNTTIFSYAQWRDNGEGMAE